ncbi:hypothetical protein LTSEMIN_5760, partial [Salmonella enterica subsp. enterica serovar Minnesota str. A4-603]
MRSLSACSMMTLVYSVSAGSGSALLSSCAAPRAR